MKTNNFIQQVSQLKLLAAGENRDQITLPNIVMVWYLYVTLRWILSYMSSIQLVEEGKCYFSYVRSKFIDND